MHESALRLLKCARQATEHLAANQRVVDFATLRERMEVSPQTLTNWKDRGVSKDGALKAESLFGCPAAWVLDGNGPDWVYPHRSDAGGSRAHEAPALSYIKPTAAPPHLEWADIMHSNLAPEFQTQAPDDAMAPDVPLGARVIFITGMQPRAGDFVLLVDRTGMHCLREYRQMRPGHWQAHAINPAYLPLDSERDGLRVLAVFDGVRGRRSNRV